MQTVPSVDICIATFRRPRLLDTLLDSIQAQDCLEQITLRVIVIDNDAMRSAESVVARHRTIAPFPVIYDVEPEQNIALARNRGLSHVQADYVVFIDDDESAAKDWLSKLLDARNTYDADVVFGPVIPILPPDVADWCRRGRFFERRRYPTGTQRFFGATNNTLIRTRFLVDKDLFFDASYGLTGGSDTELFWRAHRKGARMIWCDEAEVREVVPPERATTGWLLRRAYRGGQVYARIFSRDQTWLERKSWTTKRILYFGAAGFLLLAIGGLRKEWRVHALQKMATNLGQITGLYGATYEEYRHDG